MNQIQYLLTLADPTIPLGRQWGLFDLAASPLPTFCRGRICVIGDAAHASTPHHGAGAGFCVEDAAVLAALLADERVRDAAAATGDGGGGGGGLEAAFAAFDAARRPRDQWLVQSSRRAGDLYEWRAEGVGRDIQAIAREVRERQARVWGIDLDADIERARQDLGRRLGRGRL